MMNEIIILDDLSTLSAISARQDRATMLPATTNIQRASSRSASEYSSALRLMEFLFDNIQHLHASGSAWQGRIARKLAYIEDSVVSLFNTYLI